MINYSVANEKSPGKCIHPHGGCFVECSRQNLVDLKDGTIVILTRAGDEVGGGGGVSRQSLRIFNVKNLCSTSSFTHHDRPGVSFWTL